MRRTLKSRTHTLTPADAHRRRTCKSARPQAHRAPAISKPTRARPARHHADAPTQQRYCRNCGCRGCCTAPDESRPTFAHDPQQSDRKAAAAQCPTTPPPRSASTLWRAPRPRWATSAKGGRPRPLLAWLWLSRSARAPGRSMRLPAGMRTRTTAHVGGSGGWRQGGTEAQDVSVHAVWLFREPGPPPQIARVYLACGPPDVVVRGCSPGQKEEDARIRRRVCAKSLALMVTRFLPGRPRSTREARASPQGAQVARRGAGPGRPRLRHPVRAPVCPLSRSRTVKCDQARAGASARASARARARSGQPHSSPRLQSQTAPLSAHGTPPGALREVGLSAICCELDFGIPGTVQGSKPSRGRSSACGTSS